MDDDLDAMPAAGIFPFLSVLQCTIGAMILILVAGALRMVVTDPELTQKIVVRRKQSVTLTAKSNDTRTELAGFRKRTAIAREEASSLSQREMSLQGQTQNTQRELSALAQRNVAVARQMEEKRTRIEDLRRETVEVKAIPQKLEAAAERPTVESASNDAQSKWETLAEDIKKLEDETGRLGSELRTLNDRKAALEKMNAQPEVRVKTISAVQGRTPVYFELREDSFIILSDGISLPAGTTIARSDALREEGPLGKLAAELAPPDSTHCAVLLVRPGAVEIFRAATRAFRRWRTPFGHEPVEADWKLKLEDLVASRP